VKRRSSALLFCIFAGIALPAFCQDGLRLPSRAEGSGIDPSFAAGWLSPERERRGFAPYHWRDAVGFTPTTRAQWSYTFGRQASLGMSVASGRDFDTAPIFGMESRQYGLFGRYSLAPDWSLSAEAISREPNTLFRLQDFRIGLRRQF
jgi:hypothetical protein